MEEGEKKVKRSIWNNKPIKTRGVRYAEAPYSLGARIDRWNKLRKGTHKILWTIAEDPDKPDTEIMQTETFVKVKDLPHEAVRLTGDDRIYVHDTLRIRYGEHDNGFSAVHACLWMECNKIDGNIAHLWGMKSPLDKKKIAMIAGIGIFIIAYCWWMYR